MRAQKPQKGNRMRFARQTARGSVAVWTQNRTATEPSLTTLPLDEEIFIRAPAGFTGPEAGAVLRLNKALYGLKQSGRCWNQTVVQALLELGFEATPIDPCLFTQRSSTGKLIYVGLYVDDMPYAFHRDDTAQWLQLQAKMKQRFSIKDLGQVEQILGMRVTRDRSARTLKIDQEHYVRLNDILAEYGYSNCRAERTPMPSQRLSGREAAAAKATTSSHGQVTLENYRSAIGGLQYAANSTRPDISFAVGMLAPTADSCKQLIRVLRYLAGTPALGLTYRARGLPALTLTAFSDADWANEYAKPASTTGSLLKLAGAAVVWRSQKQTTIAQSSTEAEYVAASETAREIYPLRVQLAHLDHAQPEPTTLAIDNTTTILVATEEGNMQRRKHINVKYHYLRHQVAKGFIRLAWVPTAEQEADIFTKALPYDAFIRLRQLVMG